MKKKSKRLLKSRGKNKIAVPYPRNEKRKPLAGDRIQKLYLFLSVFVSGATVLVLEIIGTRILSPFYGSTIYVWSSLITVAMFALSVGYFLGGRLADSKNNTSVFYKIISLAGVSLFVLFQFKAAIFIFSDKFGYRFGPLVSAFILFGLPLALLGFLSPLAIKMSTETLTTLGRKTGHIFAFSTMGSLTGALLAGFFLLPLISSNDLIKIVALLLFVIGILGLYINKRLKVGNRETKLIVLTVLLILGGNMAKKELTKSIPQRAQLLYEKENYYGLNRVAAVPIIGGQVCFMVDNSIQTCIAPGTTKDRVGYNGKMGLFIKNLPSNSNVLILGFGSGKLLKDWDREDLKFDIVDINPETFKAAKDYSGVNFVESRHNIIINDARAFIRGVMDKKYDLVVLDTFTGFSPPEHLFTKEFYELISTRMNEGAGLIFHTLGDLDSRDKYVASVVSTASLVFDKVYASEDGVSIVVYTFKDRESGLADLVNKDVQIINDTYENAMSPFTLVEKGNAMLAAEPITDDKNFSELLWRDKIPLSKNHTLILPEDYL